MKAQDLKNSILQLAIKGKLVEQREEEGTARELIEQMQAEKEQLIKQKKIKKSKLLPAIGDDEKPFDIPEGWAWVRLGDIGEVVGGGTPKTGNSEFWDGGNIPWLTPADMKFVQGKYVRNGERFITEKGLKGSSARLMPKGTIIYSSRAPIGYIAIAENDLSTNQGFKSIVPFEVSINEYLYYCLKSRTNEIISRASGTTFKEISGSEFALTVVPLPPLEEQKRIVAKIEELMPYVEKYDKAYTEVDELNKKFPEDMQKSILKYAIQGKLVEQLEEEGTAEELYQKIQAEKEKLIKEGKIKKTKPLPAITEEEIPFDIPENWKWVRLGDVFDIIMGQSPKGQSVFEGDSGVEFHQGKVYFGENYLKYSNQSTNKPTKIVEPNTVLLCVRAPVGILNITARKICIGRGLCGINTLAGIDPKFVMNSLRAFKYEFIRKATGTTFVAITGEVVKTQLFPLPPLEEQKRILKKIEELLPYTKQLVKKLD